MASPMLVEKKENCFACAACKAVCPTGAITMKADEYGFEYPKIDETKCIGCQKCVKVCAYQNQNDCSIPKTAYAAVSLSTNILESASGGVFASVATEFINDSGIVVGSAMENTGDKLLPHHIAVDNLTDLKKLLGSKYVQSDTSEIFSTVKKLLDNGKKVLFSGTPCQVAALYSYLGKKYDNLYTIDIICHGVPSRKMFWDYLDVISEKFGKITDFVFRDKKRGLTFVSRIKCEQNGKIKIKYIQYGESSYYSYFLQGNTYRDCCYSCKFASENRAGDITIGDFWGIKKQHPELFDGNHTEFDADKGISCLLVNTKKGKELVENYATKLSLHPSSFEKIARENKQLYEPSIPKGNRAEIMNIYKEGGYRALENDFLKNNQKEVLMAHVKAKVPLWLKKIIKK